MFRDYLLQRLPVQELAAVFREDFGRPSKDLYVALGALILQQLHDWTDRQTTEAVALNIAWHYALDIRHEPDAYLCERTLRNYRRKHPGLYAEVAAEVARKYVERQGRGLLRQYPTQRIEAATTGSAKVELRRPTYSKDA